MTRGKQEGERQSDRDVAEMRGLLKMLWSVCCRLGREGNEASASSAAGYLRRWWVVLWKAEEFPPQTGPLTKRPSQDCNMQVKEL